MIGETGMTTPRDEDISSLFDNEVHDNDLIKDLTKDLAENDGADAMRETERTLDQLCQDRECIQRWSRYQLIHDTLQRNLPPEIDPNFSSRVMAAISSEPTILSPPVTVTNQTIENVRGHSTVSNLSNWMNNAFNKNVGKRVAGLAVAASVTAISVLSFQYNYQQQNMGQFDVSAAKNADMMAPQKIIAFDDSKSATQETTPFSSGPLSSIQSSVSNVSASNLSTNPLSPSSTAKPSVALSVKRRVPLHTNINMADPAISAHLHKFLINHSQNVSGTRLQSVMPYARIVTDSQMSASHKNKQQ